MKNSNISGKAGPMAGILGILFIALMGWLLFSAVSGVFKILSAVSIPLFILAMILNFATVKNYFGWMWNHIKEDPLKGGLIAVGSYIGHPLVSAWLAFKAYTTRQLKRSRQKQATNKKEGEDYIKYEEVDEDDNEDFLELEDLDKPRQKVKVKQTQQRTDDNKYDDLFS